MKKLLLSFLMVFLVPVIASAAPEKVMEVTFGSAGNVSAPNNQVYTATQTYTGKDNSEIAGKKWTVVNFNNNNNGWGDMIKCGRKSNASIGAVASDFTFSEKISQVDISLVVNENKVNSIVLYSSVDGNEWTEIDKNTSISASTTSVILTVPIPVENLYYKVSFDCASASKNGVVSLKSITYFKEEETNPDLLPADLSFGEKTAFTIALGEEFTEAPTLVNPHDLPVTYTSSNEEVAMVDDETGEVVLMDGIGTTTISAVFAGDNTYNAQTVRYTLTVEKQYKSIAEILTADNNSIVKINFPMTVAFVNGPNIFATDDNGDFIQIYNPNSYNANDMIPSGWSATYTLYKGVTPELINANLPQSTETKEFVPEAVNYKDLTVAEDINKVVLLKNVAFATATPSTQDNFSGTINGETVDLRNNYALASVEAGVYDVTVVVMAYSGNVSLYVTNYAAVPAPAVPELLINGKPVSGDINETDGRLSFGEVPEGIYIYYLVESSNTPSGDEAAKAPAKAAPDTMENDGKTYKLYTEPETLANGSYTISYFAYNEATGLKSEVKTINISNTVGIEGIAAEDGAAEWFNLQGVRVAEPQQGIYVRVANGKAAKVVVE